MKESLQLMLRTALQGPAVTRFLSKLGVEARRFWLLVDLFWELSERRELFSGWSTNRATLKTMSLIYFAMSAVLAIVFIASGADAFSGYLTPFLFFNVLLTFAILLPEAGNTLINPMEANVLGHQPINGATYAAAKLSHLLRIVGYLVIGLNAFPAIAGLFANHTSWTYPFVHLGAAFLIGFAAALVCCGIYGFLIRFVRPDRLKSTSQFIDGLPFIIMMGPWRFAEPVLKRLMSAEPAWRNSIIGLCAVAALCFLALGIQSLSADYLSRANAIMRARPGAVNTKRSRAGEWASRWLGGQPARAGYVYLSLMMRRDWQFRKTAIMAGYALLTILIPALVKSRIAPFSGAFTSAHFLPHALGFVMFMIMPPLAFGADCKAAWIFRMTNPALLTTFTRGLHGLLFLWFVAVPHIVLLPVACWAWGIWKAVLFFAFSAAVAAVYLSLELRLIENVPFTKQPEPTKGAMLLPLMMLGGLVIAVAVALQHYFIFRHPAAAVAATVIAAGAAWVITRTSIQSVGESMQFQLGMEANDSSGMYVEI